MRVGINAKKFKKSGLKYFAINRLKNYPCKVRQQKGLTSIDKKTKKKGLGVFSQTFLSLSYPD
jgi:hypothetical protein